MASMRRSERRGVYGSRARPSDEAVPRDAVPSETMRRVHKEIEQLIGTTFGSYRFYDE